MKLDSIWEAIDKEAAPAGLLRRRVEPDSPYDIFLLQKRPSRARSLLASFMGPSGTTWQTLSSSRGLGIEVSVSKESASIELTERDPRFRSIFDALVADILAGLRVVAGLPVAERPVPMDFVAGRIHRWQACLKTAPDGLSEEKQAGLFAELKSLYELLAHGVLPLDAVRAWAGPSYGAQDFQRGGLCVEVKASRQRKPTIVRISSERQLDTAGVSRLFLVHFALEARADGAGESLRGLVETVRQRIGYESQAGLLLDDALAAYGYLDVHAAKYDVSWFSVRAVDAFDVMDGFPRIVEGNLAPGVGDVSYGLALSACEPFRVEPEEVWTSMGVEAP